MRKVSKSCEAILAYSLEETSTPSLRWQGLDRTPQEKRRTMSWRKGVEV
nr:MAG TPA: hypothetical protein [Caudoviricetes sp.]